MRLFVPPKFYCLLTTNLNGWNGREFSLNDHLVLVSCALVIAGEHIIQC